MGYSGTPGAIIRIGVDGAAESRREIDTVARTMSNLAASVQSAMRNLAASIGIGAGVAQVVQMSDEYAKFTAQLRLATQSQREYGAAYADVKRIANDAQQGLASTGVLYARIANGTRELGTTQKQVADITETVNLALKVSGATATESASAQLQLAQAFASGTLRGEEFNAVNEAAPRLMLALADGIGVPVGALKKMAENGEITSKIMADVLPKALATLREEAKQVETISGAFTVLKNNAMEFFGVQAQASGAVAAMTGAIGLLANNLTLIAGAVATVATAKLATWLGNMATSAYGAVTANRALAAATLASGVATTEAAAVSSAAKLAEAQANVRATASEMALANARVAELRASVLAAEGAVALAIATNGLIPAQARAIALAEANTVALAAQAVAGNAATVAANAHTGALAAQTAAATIGARAMGILRGAIAFLGGPIGAVVTLLGVGALAWQVWGDKGAEAEKKVTNTLADEIDDYLGNLQKQIDKLKERNELAAKGMTTGAAPTTEGEKKREQILGEINRISKQTDLDVGTKTEMLRVWGARLNSVTQEMGDFAAAQKKSKDLAFTTEYAEWQGKNGTATQKIAYELDELRKKYGRITPEMEKFVRAKYADKGAAAQVKQEASAYTTLMTSIHEKIAANKLEQTGYSAMTDAQKMTIQLDAAIGTGKNKLSQAHIDAARAQIAVVAAQDAELLSAAGVKKAVQELSDDRNTAYASAMAEVTANEELVATYGMTKLQIEQLTLARLEDRLARRASLELDEKEVAHLERMIAAKKPNVAALGKLDKLEQGSDVTKAKELLDIMTSIDEITRSAAAGMAESFGRVGAAIGEMTTSLSGYGRTQAAIAAQLAAEKNDAKNDPVKIKAAETKASQAAAMAQIRQYSDMASAGKKFFKEHTAGYKVMEGAEKAFRAYEMAMALQAMVKKIFFKEGEVAANLALNGTKLTGEAATTAASTGLAATEASAWGVTAVVKSLASLPFPWNLAAGAATLAAVVAAGASMLGGIGGGGSAVTPSFEEKQKVQGTGTVLGDSTAKSESMAKSLEMLESYASLELDYQNSMLTALRNIETALGGAAKGIMQTAGITGGSAFGTVNSSSSNFFGSDKTTTIDDTGVKFSGTFGALRAGQGRGVQYEDVIKTSDGGWFHGDSTSKSTNTKALSAEAMKPFALIFDNMGDLLVDAGVKLGKDGATLTSAINGISVDFAVSLRDLKGQELTDALNAGVSVAFDTVTKELFPTIAQFQKMGEGIGETLVRVATDVKAVDSVFASMGKTATGLYSSAGKMASILDGMTVEAKARLVELSGGLDEFASSAKSFMQNFYTDAERINAQKAKLNPVLAQYGLSTEGADAEQLFKKFVLGLDVTTEAGAKTYAMLMGVQQAFKDVTSSAADERADLLAEWDDLTLTSAQKLAKARLEIDPANRALFDQVALQRQLKDATGGTSDALKETIDRLTATKTSTLAYLDSLALGSLSTLTPMQKYLETQRQYNAAVDKALASPADSAAASGAQSAATAFLTASQVINASSAAFIGDKSKVQGDMGRLASIAGAQMTDAQRQLSALDKQVAGLGQLNDTAAAIQQAIVNQAAPVLVAAPAFDVQRYAASSSASADVLAAEVKALRAEGAAQREINAQMLAELKQLRTDANRNAGDIVGATEEMGEAVSKEVGGAIEQAAYRAANPSRVPHR
mgnify:CR=1 FL=1